MALVTALLLLLVVTMMGVSMFRSFGIQEKIAGNVREKQRALAAAESAQQFAEWWLSSNPPPTAKICNSVVSSAIGQVCTPASAPADFTTVPWVVGGNPVGVTYTQFLSNTINGIQNTVNAAGAKSAYYAPPVFYITDLGLAGPVLGSGELYQIDAVGYGGTATAVAVVESTYIVN